MKFGNRNLLLLFSALLFSVMAGWLWNYRQPQYKQSQPSTAPSVVDYCEVDADCVIKNVGNCCGYFPRCVNIDYQPNPEAVKERCKELGLASICGFPEIEDCRCESGRCVDVYPSTR